jgi:hypothetical protein
MSEVMMGKLTVGGGEMSTPRDHHVIALSEQRIIARDARFV